MPGRKLGALGVTFLLKKKTHKKKHKNTQKKIDTNTYLLALNLRHNYLLDIFTLFTN